MIISEDHSAPVFAIAVNYNVGSRDERKGRTGFAHLFEHMMFKGSANVGPGEHPHLVFTNGGTMNGTTNKDRTLYFEILPANQLDLALFLEADRMRSLDITKANLDNQRNAVQEERRLGVDNQPYGRTFEVRDELAYDNFAYKHSVIGSMADLNAATVDDVPSFFKTYYAPNNAVLSIVGDVDPKVDAREGPEVLRVDSLAAGAARGRHHRAAADGRAAHDDRGRLARLTAARHGLQDPAELVARRRRAARARRRCSRAAAARASTRTSSARSSWRRTSSAFARREPRPRSLQHRRHRRIPARRVAELEAAIEAEIERVKTGPIEDWEIEKARNNARNQLVNSLGSALDRAITLGEDALFYNNPDRINTRADSIAKVTAADVQRVAKQYLRQDRPDRGDHGAEGRAARKEACDADRHATRTLVLVAALAVGVATSVAGTDGAGRPGTAALERRAGPQGQGAGLERRPEGQAAEAAGSRPAERVAPDGPRGSPAAAGRVPDHHSRRRRLLRSAGDDRPEHATRRR